MHAVVVLTTPMFVYHYVHCNSSLFHQPPLLRFHSLIWSNFGLGADGSAGRLVGGSENGAITVYSPDAILNSADDVIVGQSNKHTGPVKALDYNPFQASVTESCCDVEVAGSSPEWFTSTDKLRWE